MSNAVEDLGSIASLDVVRLWKEGRDKSGLPVLVITPQHLGSEDREQAFRLFEREASPIAEGPYRIVLVTSGNSVGVGLALWALRRSRSLPYALRKNLAAATVVHPDIVVRSATWILKFFMDPKVWQKVQLADRIEELVLDDVFTEGDLQTLLPASCRQFERELEVNAQDIRAQARVQGFAVSRLETGGADATSE